MLFRGVKMYFLDNKQQEGIGLNFLLDELELNTPYGYSKKKEIKPFKFANKEELLIELNNVEKIVINFNEKKIFFNEMECILSEFKDIRNSIKNKDDEYIFDDVELFEIKSFSVLLEKFIALYYKMELNLTNVKFASLREVISLLNPQGQDLNNFYVYEGYSKVLSQIREQKSDIEKKIFSEVDEIVIQDLKKERLQIVILEENEELNVRKQLSKQVLNYIYLIQENIENLALHDLLLAKGKLAIKYKGTKPRICEDLVIRLEAFFNPLFQKLFNAKGKKFIPLNLSLNNSVTVITGANMSGKTVTIKSILLNLILGQMGFFVFAKHAEFPIFDNVSFISEDSQSVSKGLSSFGGEIIKIKELLQNCKHDRVFLAMDEFANNTNPIEGSSLMKALLHYLNKLEFISLVVTHYDGVIDMGMDHYQVIGLKNVNIKELIRKIDISKENSIEIIQDYIDYRLEKVSGNLAVPKDAINISIMLGLDEEITNAAINYLAEVKKNA